jgi:nucleoid-associated protein YgaU
LAHKHYGDANLWWIIAWYNKKPTEAHVKMGDIITIPLPLDKVIRYLGV